MTSGDVQYTSKKGHPWLLKLEKTAYRETHDGRRLEIFLSHTTQDGNQLVQCHKQMHICEEESLPGGLSGSITSLPVFPRNFLENPSLESKLEKRGIHCESLRGVLNMRYDGLSEYQRSPPRSFFHPAMSHFDLVWILFMASERAKADDILLLYLIDLQETARVVIDPETFFTDFAQAKKNIIPSFSEKYRAWVEARFGSLEKANRVLCCPYIFGFSLQRKEWCKFIVKNLQDIEWNTDALPGLVLPEMQKKILQALVTSHEFPSSDVREESQQKGRGLVILLHGSPGSGKTLTAGKCC